MKTYIYMGKDFQLLLEAKSKKSAITKIKRILGLSEINEGRVGESKTAA